jgi:hypothetical protein
MQTGAKKYGGSRHQNDKDDEAVARARSVERRTKADAAASKAGKDTAAGSKAGSDKDFAEKRRAREAAAKAEAAAAGGKKAAKPSA